VHKSRLAAGAVPWTGGELVLHCRPDALTPQLDITFEGRATCRMLAWYSNHIIMYTYIALSL
jgi:hypothetical protein